MNPLNDNYYIASSNFILISIDGAVYLYQTQNLTNVLAEKCLFDTCSTNATTRSAALYCWTTRGNIVQQFNCFRNNVSPYYSAFYSVAQDISNASNFAKYCSISNNGDEMISIERIDSQSWGNITENNSNITNNRVQSSIFSNHLYLCNGVRSFCTIKNNNQTKSGSQLIYMTSNQVEFVYLSKYCNIIGNKCNEYLYYSVYNNTIDNCIFDQNVARTTFFCQNSGYSITLTNSYVSSFSSSGSGSVSQVSPINKISSISFINYNCKFAIAKCENAVILSCHYSFNFINIYYLINPVLIF